MNQQDKFNFAMQFSLDKLPAGQTEWKPWNLDNQYNGLDYGQVVALQAILMKAMVDVFTMLGITQAEQIGFDMTMLKQQLAGMTQQGNAQQNVPQQGRMVGER